jgi:peptidoglycan/LPS O-acetylase OafA/YrhL
MRYPMLAVDTFFFLSGFVLAYIYAEKFDSFSSAVKNSSRFIAYRFGRIYPLHIITFAAVILLTWVGIYADGNPLAEAKILRNNTAETAIYHTLLLHGTGIVKGASWNYPSWSISVEFMLYLAFPLFIPIISRIKYWHIHLVIIGGVCYYYFSTIVDPALRFDGKMPSDHPALFIPSVWANDIVRGLANFIIGLSLYQLYSQNFLKKLPWDVILLAICATMMWMMLNRTPMNVVILIMPIFIYALANLKSFMCKFFNNKILVYLGEISYGLYMWHIPYGMFVLHVFYDNNVGVEFWQWRFVLMMAGLIALSSLSYHLFETPCRRNIKRMVDNKQTRAENE